MPAERDTTDRPALIALTGSGAVIGDLAQMELLRELLLDLNRRGHSLDTLSMGMSGDLEAAIAEGATIVRVGTAIFGPRT